MSDFDFFTILLSFVISLGVTTLLAAVARLVQESGRVIFSWRYALWAAAIFNLQVTFWIKSWSYRDTYEMHISTALPPLVLAIAAFLACGLATPPIPEKGPIDLKAFHDSNGKKYALAFAIFMVLAIVQAAMYGDLFPNGASAPVDALMQAGFAMLAAATALFRKARWLQVGAPLVLIVASLGYYEKLIGW
ncbi:MAG: hypothetical protein IT548_12840 [Alphaproteobacteria bacterium]|nr:hypothetical protein [Alphaproteobacteria bacterium]